MNVSESQLINGKSDPPARGTMKPWKEFVPEFRGGTFIHEFPSLGDLA